MCLLLVAVYMLLAWFSSLDPFASADFMYTLFFLGSCCVLCALIAREIDSLFAETFVILQSIALANYVAMALSYSKFDAAGMAHLEFTNHLLIVADIIALIGVLLGDRWLLNRTG